MWHSIAFYIVCVSATQNSSRQQYFVKTIMNATSDICLIEELDFLYDPMPMCPCDGTVADSGYAKLPNFPVIHPPCHKMMELTDQIYPGVILMNTTQLLAHLGNQTIGMCSLVFFYALWCPFSMDMSPVVNAVGRLLPTVPVIAVDVGAQVNVHPSTQVR